MAYKTGGVKTKYIYSYEHDYKEYTIYRAVNSTNDLCVYKMFDENDNECPIDPDIEDDSCDKGNHSLIDCLYHLKNKSNMKCNNKDYNIIIEEMTEEEMHKVFGR